MLDVDSLKRKVVKIIEYSPGIVPSGETPDLHNDFDVKIFDNSIDLVILPGSMLDLSGGVDSLYNKLFSILSFNLRGHYQLYKQFKAMTNIVDGYTALVFPFKVGNYMRIVSDIRTVLSWHTRDVPLQLFKNGSHITYEGVSPYSSFAVDGVSRSGKTTFLLYLMRVLLHLDPYNMGKSYSYVYAVDPKLSRLALYLKQHRVPNAEAVVPDFKSGVGSNYVDKINDLLGKIIRIEGKRQRIIWDHSTQANGVNGFSFQFKPIYVILDEMSLLSKMASSKVLKVMRSRLDYIASSGRGFLIFLVVCSQSLSVTNSGVSTLLLDQCNVRIHCGLLLGGKSVVPTSNLIMMPSAKYTGVYSNNGVVESLLLPTVR